MAWISRRLGRILLCGAIWGSLFISVRAISRFLVISAILIIIALALISLIVLAFVRP
jgi:hypothetical protein